MDGGGKGARGIIIRKYLHVRFDGLIFGRDSQSLAWNIKLSGFVRSLPWNVMSILAGTAEKLESWATQSMRMEKYLQFLGLVDGLEWTKNPENSQNFHGFLGSRVDGRLILIPVYNTC